MLTAVRVNLGVPNFLAAVLIGEYRITKSELGDAGSDLCHLSIRMRASVAVIRDQPLDRPAAVTDSYRIDPCNYSAPFTFYG